MIFGDLVFVFDIEMLSSLKLACACVEREPEAILLRRCPTSVQPTPPLQLTDALIHWCTPKSRWRNCARYQCELQTTKHEGNTQTKVTITQQNHSSTTRSVTSATEPCDVWFLGTSQGVQNHRVDVATPLHALMTRRCKTTKQQWNYHFPSVSFFRFFLLELHFSVFCYLYFS